MGWMMDTKITQGRFLNAEICAMKTTWVAWSFIAENCIVAMIRGLRAGCRHLNLDLQWKNFVLQKWAITITCTTTL